MESLAQFFLAVTGLFEAEGLVLKRNVVRLFVAAGLGLIVFGLAVTGMGLLLLSLFRVLSPPLGPDGAALVLGVVAMLLAGIALLWARRLLR